MRILYLVHQFFPRHYTGTERLTLDLAEHMQRIGHSPLVVTYDRDAGQDGFVRLQDNVLVKRYSYRTIPVISLKQTTLRAIHEIFDERIGRAFDKLRIECDIVHICHPMWLSSIATRLKEGGIPVLLTLTDPWLLCPLALVDRGYRLCSGPERGLRCASNCGFDRRMSTRYKEAMTLLSAANYVATSSGFTASLFRENGWPKEIPLVRHSINYRYVKPTHRLVDPGNIRFGFIGSFVWHKGAHVLAKAFRKVSAQNVSLSLYGSPHDEPGYFKELLGITQGDDRIRFLDPFDMDALPEVMSDTSVLVVPSVYYDNYPLVTLIGLAYRVPVIGSRIGGIPEIIDHGVNGLLFQPGNSDELASVIEEVAREPEIIQRLAENIATPRRTEEEALDYENIYRNLTSR
jgi:glycosyltransferase involved in cell wall biosynthesis